MTLDEAKKEFYFYQQDQAGGFFTALLNALMKADHENFALLREAYPELADVVKKFRGTEGYWETLVFEVETSLGINTQQHAITVLAGKQPTYFDMDEEMKKF